MCCAPPLPHLAKPRPHDASVRGFHDDCCGPDDAAQYNHCCAQPALARPHPHDAALSAFQDCRRRATVEDAARMARRLASATAFPGTTAFKPGDRWRRQASTPTVPPHQKPGSSSRCGQLESLLPVLILTACLLILPLVLPQLPPPPVALLLVPLAVMAASLLVLAFLPSDSRAATTALFVGGRRGGE